MKATTFFLLVLLIFLCAGCRSSCTGSSHIETESDRLDQSRSDSINFTDKFAKYLHNQESNLDIHIVKFYPPAPGDTASHGAIESVTDLNLNNKKTSDSTVHQKNLTVTSDTTSNHLNEESEELTTLAIKTTPWYEPFIPYFVLGLLFTAIYYLRRRK